MKTTTNKLLALLLALTMVFSCVTPVFAAGTEGSFAYEGEEVTFIKADGSDFGMFAPQEGTTAVINGGDVVIHYVPKSTTVYCAIHWGGIWDEELTKDVAFNDDGTFDITLSKDRCGTAIPVAPVKTEDRGGGTTAEQYYLAIPAEDKLENVTPVEPTPADERTELAVINTAGMFKAATAYLETVDGQTRLVVALSGTSYHYLFRGNYAEAVDNGDNRDNWIAYHQDDQGKFAFVLPLEKDESYLPVVSISNNYLTKYENGENPLERAFYPRQLVLDREAGTLTVGDYDETLTVAVKSNAEEFHVDRTARMRVVGGPNSNNYNVVPTLQMLDDTYDQVTYPTVAGGQVTTATMELTADKTFVISLLNAPTKEAFRDREPIDMQFRVKATGQLVTYQVTIDLLAGTVTVDGVGSVTPVDPADGEAVTPVDPADGEEKPTDTADKAPRTGDTGVTLWVVLACVSAAGVAVTLGRKRDEAAR